MDKLIWSYNPLVTLVLFHHRYPIFKTFNHSCYVTLSPVPRDRAQHLWPWRQAQRPRQAVTGAGPHRTRHGRRRRHDIHDARGIRMYPGSLKVVVTCCNLVDGCRWYHKCIPALTWFHPNKTIAIQSPSSEWCVKAMFCPHLNWACLWFTTAIIRQTDTYRLGKKVCTLLLKKT